MARFTNVVDVAPVPPDAAVTSVVSPVAAVACTAPPGTTLPAESFQRYRNVPAPAVVASETEVPDLPTVTSVTSSDLA